MKLLMPSILPVYKKHYLKHDVLAALVVTAIAIPESLGFAVIVGLPPVVGLYTALLAPIVFGIVAHTRRLIVGADSATAALIASGAVLVAQSGTAGYANAVGVIGLLVAAILLLFGIFRMGFLANLISRPVLVGFLAGVGVQLIVTRLPSMLGIEASGSIWQHATTLFGQIANFNGMALTISILVVGVVVTLRRTRVPGELIGVVLATLFALAFHVSDYGVALVGALPGGLPAFAFPELSTELVVTLFPAALSIAVVILAQSSSVVHGLARQHDEKVHMNRDLFALGFGNAASALTQGFALNGSPPRSVASDLAGGKTQLVNVIMGLLIGALLLFGSSLFVWMPEAALSSIICILGVRLIRARELAHLWEMHRVEFFVAMIALVGTVVFGVLQGILIAVVVSLMERLSRQYRPKDDVLLRDGVYSKWATERLGLDEKDTHGPRGLLIYSFNGSLFFENCNYFVARVKRVVEKAEHPVDLIVIDAAAIESIDYTASEELKLLEHRLEKMGTKLAFAHASPELRAQFDDFGITDRVGSSHMYATVASALKVATHARHESHRE